MGAQPDCGPPRGCLARGTPADTSPDVAAIVYADPAKGGDGSYHVSGEKERIQWRWRYGQLNQGGISSSLPASGASQDIVVDLGAQGVAGDSEIAYFWARETSGNLRFLVRPQVGPPLNQYLSNVALSSNLVFGTAQLPGYLPSTIYAYLNSDVTFNAQGPAGGAARTVQCGVFCRTWLGGKEDEARRAAHRTPYVPMWIGPESKMNPALTGPEVTIAPGATAVLRFPAPYDADFILGWILDDSTSTTGLEPSMEARIQDEASREQLIDFPTGLDWRNFIACPTVTITGMPTGGVLRAMSLKSPKGGWTHRVPRTSGLEVTIVSTDAGTITFRGCLLGWAVKTAGMASAGGDRPTSAGLGARR